MRRPPKSVDDRHPSAPRRSPRRDRAAPRVATDGARFPLPTAELERVAEAMLAAATRRRRDGGRDRGLAGGRPERHRAQAAKSRPSPTTATRASASPSIVGQRRGHASTADFSAEAIDADRRQGARDRALHGRGSGAPGSPIRTGSRARFPDLDLYHPWDLPVEDAIALGREAEAAALAVDPPPHQHRRRDGRARRIGIRLRELATAFCGGYRSSRHHIDCSVIGDAGDGAMQRDYWYTAARAPRGSRAGRRGRAHRRRAHRAPARTRASSARSNARCCSRRPRPPT